MTKSESKRLVAELSEKFKCDINFMNKNTVSLLKVNDSYAEVLDIPEGIYRLGARALAGMKRLKQITFPKSLMRMDEGVFASCTSLQEIDFPVVNVLEDNNKKPFTFIPKSSFDGCTSLKTVTIPESCAFIDNYAFRGCTALTTITLPKNLKKICNGAFEGCTSLSSVIIPNGTEEIGYSAFRNTALRSVVIPKSVTKIDADAFDDECEIIREN